MNILFDGQAFIHQRVGGVSRYYASLIEEMNALSGVSAKTLAPLHRNVYLSHLPPGSVVGFGYGDGPQAARLCWYALRFLSSPLSRFMSPDIIHETYFSRFPFVAGNAKRVTTVYDMIHERLLADGKTELAKCATLRRCDHVFCISQSTRADLCELLDFPEERTTVTHLGYQNLEPFVPTEVLPEFAAGRPYFFYVGQRAGYKNFDLLMVALSRCARLKSEARIVCFGGGPLDAHELARATELGLDSRHLTWLAGSSDTLLASGYANALGFIYPSRYEGFGLPPLEAMSVGCPVVCGNTSSLPEVVGDAALMIDPSDADQLADALDKLAHASELRRGLIAKGHQRRALFSWKKCALETLQGYQRLL